MAERWEVSIEFTENGYYVEVDDDPFDLGTLSRRKFVFLTADAVGHFITDTIPRPPGVYKKPTGKSSGLEDALFDTTPPPSEDY